MISSYYQYNYLLIVLTKKNLSSFLTIFETKQAIIFFFKSIEFVLQIWYMFVMYSLILICFLCIIVRINFPNSQWGFDFPKIRLITHLAFWVNNRHSTFESSTIFTIVDSTSTIKHQRRYAFGGI